MGDKGIVPLLRLLRPSVLVPLLNDSIGQEGPLSAAIAIQGDLPGLPDKLARAGVRVLVAEPAEPGKVTTIRVPTYDEVAGTQRL